MRMKKPLSNIRIVAVCLLAVIVAFLPACAVHQPRESVTPPVKLPESFSRATASSDLVDRWWESFEQPALTGLIQNTLSDNLDLRAAWRRLDQFSALAVQAGARRYPELSGEASTSRTRSSFYAGEELGERSFATNQFPLNLSASYEVDLWGRVASLEEAAGFDLLVSRQDLEAMAISMAAQVAETWFSAVEQETQLKLVADQLAVGQTYLELVELRFGQGLASAVDVYQQRLQVASTRAQIAPTRSQRQVLENQLAVLQGKMPGTAWLDIPAVLPELPELPPAGMPADLLNKRPDVRAAYLRIMAADRRLGAAVADRYPALRLTARTGFQGRQVQDIFSNWIYSLAANLTAPLFDGNRRKAEVERNEARVAELINAYGSVLLQAVREVEDALTQEESQRQQLRDLGVQLELARSSLVRARARYANGLSDYLPVLTALQSQQQLERSIISARRQLISYRIQIYRALGGTWTTALQRHPVWPPDKTMELTNESHPTHP
ncbi:MAG: efflux transporter outer membrane subunit [Acidobacteria bacterium]|nr:efflux transporter outer membrane subunit [Acidobacteriota bacterium]